MTSRPPNGEHPTGLRRTKIIATLGPTSATPEAIDAMIAAGVDLVRLNFSHGQPDDHLARARLVQERAAAHRRVVGVLADLQGPKIRIQRFREGPVELNEGDSFALEVDRPEDAGDQSGVGITYPDLPSDVVPGDVLLLDDGRIVLTVTGIHDQRVECRVTVGGLLSDNKGINRQGGGLSAAALTDKDRADIRTIAEMGADYMAISFPRSAADIAEGRALLREAGGHGGIIAKIERAEALQSLEEIIAASDAVMIARGDLGVEIGDAELPAVQKQIIKTARSMNRVSITATQMMESMIDNPIPTRAEVFDVANAVLDGTDAVMLSAETATGRYPAKAVKAMGRICREAEKQRPAKVSDHRINSRFGRIDEAVAMATMYTANHLGVRAIVTLTESGATPLWMSRISSGIPIYAFTRQAQTGRRVTLYRGVYPIAFDITTTDHAQVNRDAVAELTRQLALTDDDLIILTKGDLAGVHGGTNAMKILRVGDLAFDEEI